jgi:hypothetical protein
MARKKRTLTATMADGYVKTITTAAPFTHYWRIVAHLAGGKTEVFWGHATSFKEAAGKKIATGEAARQRGWEGSTSKSSNLPKARPGPYQGESSPRTLIRGPASSLSSERQRPPEHRVPSKGMRASLIESQPRIKPHARTHAPVNQSSRQEGVAGEAQSPPGVDRDPVGFPRHPAIG